MSVYPVPQSGSMARKYDGKGHALGAINGSELVDYIYIRDAIPDFDGSDFEAMEALDDPRIEAATERLLAKGEVVVGIISAGEFIQI